MFSGYIIGKEMIIKWGKEKWDLFLRGFFRFVCSFIVRLLMFFFVVILSKVCLEVFDGKLVNSDVLSFY